MAERVLLSSAEPAIAIDAVFSALPNPVLVVGADRRLHDVNPAAEQFFHAGRGHLIGQALDALVPHGSPVLPLLGQAVGAAMTVSEHEVDLGSPRTGARLANVSIAPIIEAPGAAVIVLQETSVTNHMDRQLSHRGSARVVNGMAAVLAHEIKNPLSGIRGAAQLLESAVAGDDRVLTKLICDETDRVCALVDRMESFSDDAVAREPVNIHEVLERVRRIAETGFAMHVDVVERYDPSLPPVHGNPDQLVQIFLNLIKNAAEAISSPGGRIVLATAFRHGVRLAVAGSRARHGLPLEVTIADNGTGVPEDLLPHLFDPFVTTKRSGTGLGLALVAKLIDDHGGTIACESVPGDTVFRVLLPVHEGARAQ